MYQFLALSSVAQLDLSWVLFQVKDRTPVVKEIDILRILDFLYFYLRAEPTATSTANTFTIPRTGCSDKSSLFSIDSGSHFKA